jgi:hypothetical protein
MSEQSEDRQLATVLAHHSAPKSRTKSDFCCSPFSDRPHDSGSNRDERSGRPTESEQRRRDLTHELQQQDKKSTNPSGEHQIQESMQRMNLRPGRPDSAAEKNSDLGCNRGLDGKEKSKQEVECDTGENSRQLNRTPPGSALDRTKD